MDSGKITLLSQLATALKDNFFTFQKAYLYSNKEDFDFSKKVILELQHKIEYLLKK